MGGRLGAVLLVGFDLGLEFGDAGSRIASPPLLATPRQRAVASGDLRLATVNGARCCTELIGQLVDPLQFDEIWSEAGHRRPRARSPCDRSAAGADRLRQLDRGRGHSGSITSVGIVVPTCSMTVRGAGAGAGAGPSTVVVAGTVGSTWVTSPAACAIVVVGAPPGSTGAAGSTVVAGAFGSTGALGSTGVAGGGATTVTTHSLPGRYRRAAGRAGGRRRLPVLERLTPSAPRPCTSSRSAPGTCRPAPSHAGGDELGDVVHRRVGVGVADPAPRSSAAA